MKKINKFLGILLLVAGILIPQLLFAQLCEPIYSVEKVQITNNPVGQMTCKQNNLLLTVGQPALIFNATNYAKNSLATGFWSHYLKEPAAPLVRASDGDFQDMVLVEWDIEGDRTGPPVTSQEVTLYRNNYILTTLPIQQTQYQDLNVFPGMYYTYGVSVENDLGKSHTENDIGFLNPNGMITGHVETPSGNPVFKTKVLLKPNLGRCAKFTGDSYIYWFDGAVNTNHQFTGLEGSYTIETWFRSLRRQEQVLFAAVDSASTKHYLTLSLTAAGKVKWTHQPVAGEGGTELVTMNAYAGFNEEWHHLAVVYADSNRSMTMYIDGFLVGESVAAGPLNDKVELILGKRGPREPVDYLVGRLDDFRIWSCTRKWDDLRDMMDITLSGEEDSLAAYWKFDEVDGETVFDLTDRDLDGATCRLERDNLIAPVYLGALTDLYGNYAIKGIYYADGTVFTVTPGMASPIGRSLEFDGIDDFVQFERRRIDLTGGYTLEGWFKTPANGEQTILAAVDPADNSPRISIRLNNGQIRASHFESEITTTTTWNDNLWHHFAVTCDNSTFTLLLEGKVYGSAPVSLSIPNLSEPVIGRKSPEDAQCYFRGRLDEIRLWKAARTEAQVGGTMNQVLEGDEFGLAHYWRLNAGTGNLVNDATGTATGTIAGADSVELKKMWSQDIPLNEYFEHWYEPESRNAALNNTNTAVNNVDFTDESLIPVSGYVRYLETACFQEGVEILLNGESLMPPVYTNSDGKWILDLEPGSVGDQISCRYRDHEFTPALIELPVITQPITGLFFDDRTAYKVNGYVAGGSCKFPITPSQGQIEVTFSSVNGCLERTVVPDPATGMYESPYLPPIIFNLSVKHPDPGINAFFVGDTLSLENSDRERNFIYRAPLEVEFVNLPESEVFCELFPMVIKQRYSYEIDVSVFERYGENKCTVGVYDIQGNDNISDTTYAAKINLEEPLTLTFSGKDVNILDGGEHPYQKNLQVTVTDTLERTASANFWVFVEGDEKVPGKNFSTTTSKMPWWVLRVPPGDGSSTYLATDQTTCKSTSFANTHEITEEFGVTAHLGSEIMTFAGAGIGAFAGVVNKTETTFDIGGEFSFTQTWNEVDESCECLTTSETYSTSGDGVTGDDATVFIGGGYTVDVGIARYLRIDTTACQVVIDTVLTIDPSGVHSTYIHSKYYIKNTLIPDLRRQYLLSGDPNALADLNYWKEILHKDSVAVATAVPSELLEIGAEGEKSANVSFDAGASLEYSYSRESSSSNINTFTVNEMQKLALEQGFDCFGLGWTTNEAFSHTHTDEETESTSETKTQTIGFVLDDDDPGDGFAFAVKRDRYWDMPVFELIGGQSSCPYESGTIRRHTAALSISENLQVDVPPNEPAVFTLLLGNNSGTGETDTYILSALNESNPDGAVLMTSENLANGVSYSLEAGDVLPVTLQILRGPEKYDYDNLTLELAPACGGQDETSATISFSVHFQEPCSESHIASPKSGWLIDSSQDSDTLWVTVDGYNWPADSFMTSIDLQYRPASGGDWFTACSVLRDSLKESYVLLPFNISSALFPDGAYELRSQAMCNGGKYPGISPIVSGLIDRSAPQVLGLPEPVDGILGPDDIIRVTLNEEIACGEIKPGAGDIMLFNTVTGKAMDYTYTCGGNIITFEPNVQNLFIENQIFRAEIHNLQDIYGNRRAPDEPIVWEFYVNRNPLEWGGNSVENVVIYVDQEFSTKRELINHGGSNRSWQLIGGREGAMPSGEPLDLPNWLEVSPTQGTLTPGEAQEVTIGLAEDLGFGEYKSTIYAAGTMGDEPLPVSIRKLCYPPIWEIDPGQFQYTMTMIAVLAVDSILSEDVYDQIGVFVGEELRGVANIQSVPALKDLANTHPYEVFLTIYSNQTRGEVLDFRVWDASQCRELGRIVETYTFAANANHGTPTSPVTITATSQIISQMQFSPGWRWFSFNLKAPDMSANTILQSLEPADSDLIKSQTGFNQYVQNYGWVGNLDTLGTKSMYQMRLSRADTLEMVGYPVNVETDTIPVVRGWNWIGYTPQQAIGINEALYSLRAAATGDLIKSQLKFSQFVEGLGWIGSLQFMHPNQGYLLNVMNPAKLCYPFYPEGQGGLAKAPADTMPAVTRWPVNTIAHAKSMTLTAVVNVDQVEADTSADVLGAFVGDPADPASWEWRGAARAMYLPQLHRYLFFLMIYGEAAESKQIQFRFFDASRNEVLYVPLEMEFEPDARYGSPDAPQEFIARPLGIGDPGFIPDEFSLSENFPNPFNPVTKIGYGVPKKSQVEIIVYDLLGRKVKTLVSGIQEPGYRFATWDSTDENGLPVASGVYFFRIKAGVPAGNTKQGLHTVKKMVLIK